MKMDLSYLRKTFVELLAKHPTYPVEVALWNAVQNIDAGTLTETHMRDVEAALATTINLEHFE